MITTTAYVSSLTMVFAATTTTTAFIYFICFIYRYFYHYTIIILGTILIVIFTIAAIVTIILTITTILRQLLIVIRHCYCEIIVKCNIHRRTTSTEPVELTRLIRLRICQVDSRLLYMIENETRQVKFFAWDGNDNWNISKTILLSIITYDYYYCKLIIKLNITITIYGNELGRICRTDSLKLPANLSDWSVFVTIENARARRVKFFVRHEKL